jgi:hypothetical protein
MIALLTHLAWLCGAASAVSVEASAPRGELILIVGAAGTDEYGAMFQQWAKQWAEAAERGNFSRTLLGLSGEEPATRESITQTLRDVDEEPALPLWIVMIGHGTYDGRTARFNLTGPDLTPQDLQQSLDRLTRPVAVINCTAASAPFLEVLSGENRVIITATRSGGEVNFAWFGQYLAEAVSSLEADLDKDGQVSLLEAFLHASRKTEERYVSDGRLVTEHALLDDNGDGKGTGAAAYRGIRPVAEPAEEGVLLDGYVAHQWHLIPNEFDRDLSPEAIARRNELELDLARLRSRKSSMDEDAYYERLEEILTDLARLLLEDREPSATSAPE